MVAPSERSSPQSSSDPPRAIGDQDLLMLCKKGDRHGFHHLYKRYHHRIRSTLFQLCGAESLDDLEQEVFLRIWKGLHTFQHQAQLSTWIYRITWNVALDQRRKLAKHHQRQHQLTQELRDDGSGVTSSVDLKTLHYQELVQLALNQLGDDHRLILVLHDLQDLPQKEIASILEIPVGTVKSRLFQARSQLRQFFHQEGIEL